MVASPGSRDDRMVGRAGLTPFKNLERMTRIEPALSAWESERSRLLCGLTCGMRCPEVTVANRWSPRLMAR
jgi:hypothetical protein